MHIPFLILALGLCRIAALADEPPAKAWKEPLPPRPAVGDIMDRALAHSEWQREERFEHRLLARQVIIEKKLDDDKNATETSTKIYRIYPVDGHSFDDLIERNGEPVSEEEREDRKKSFREEIAKPPEERDKDETDIRFNRELMSRYQAKLAGKEKIKGRMAWVIRFWPKEGKLPVNRRIDHALNNSRGRVWVDDEDYGILRVEFELIKPVKFWGGILGVIREVEGHLETHRFEEGVYLPKSFEIYLEGRILFKGLHKTMEMDRESMELLPAGKVQAVQAE